MPTTHLFVYGTLRSDSPKSVSLKKQINQHAQYIGKAVFRGQLYEISGYPGAVQSGSVNEEVTGEVYEMKNSAQLLPLIDDYEGCSPRYSEPHQFIRKELPVFLESGEEIKAWVYLYNWDLTGKKRIENGDYIEFLK